jgi:hypothetical protein
MTRRLWQDLFIIAASVFVAIIISQTELIRVILDRSLQANPLESFIAGLFFTSAFTTAPAIVVLGKLAQAGNLATVAIFGALGAVCGDFIIFKFIRDRLGEDLKALFKIHPSKRVAHILRSHMFRWFSPFVAALVIASPLPDELALAVLGLANTQTRFFLPFSFMSNLVGILLVGAVARSI